MKNIKELKRQCSEYQDFIENIQQITKDYCLFYKKENPLDGWSFGCQDGIEIDADDNGITIYWEDGEYICGDYETEYKSMYIPLDFYDNLSDYEIKKNQALEDIKELEKDKKNLQNEKNKIDSNIREINKDEFDLLSSSKKYGFEIPKDTFKKRLSVLKKEQDSFIMKIKEIDKKITSLKLTI